MKNLLLSIFALAIVTAPVFGEDDQDQPKPPRNNRPPNQTPPQRQVNPAPRPVTPRVQNNLSPKPQPQSQNKPPVTNRKYAPPKSYTPDVQARLWRNTPQTKPADQNTARTNRPNRNWQNRDWQNDPTTNAGPNTTSRNRDWQNNNNSNNTANRNWQNRTNNTNRATTTNRTWQNRNWQNNTTGYSTYTWDQARSRHRHDRHDRGWWRNHYNRIVLFGGGYYYWDDGYWYPAYGYDPYYSTYAYDEPIYGYDNLPPGQVITNVQGALQELGYYNDAVDGLIGPNTRAALRNFQRDRGLPITASIDGPTLKALGLY